MYRIMLVDDEELELEALKIMLEEIKNEIVISGEAKNGKQAVELDVKLNPDIIIMDIKMPVLDGLKAAEIIKKKNEDKIIIMLTAYEDYDLIRNTLQLGINDYILKPIKTESLLKSLKTGIANIEINRSRINEGDSVAGIKYEGRHIDLSHVNKSLEPALNYIEKNWGEKLTLDKAASASNLSVFYFSKLFKRELGMNFVDYITMVKIEKAKEMLSNTDMPIINIALELGYDESGYFTKVFKRKVGQTPSEYRNFHIRD